MIRKDYVLAILSTSQGGRYTPVQLQKLFFILDREVPEQIDGPMFDFQPYDYGPFDKAVYGELEQLAIDGLTFRTGNANGRYRSYGTTIAGQREGERLLKAMHLNVQKYSIEVSEFVRSCSFSELVTAVYKQYPETKVNSVFK